MSNEDVKWISSTEELEALPIGTVVTDYDSRQWTLTTSGWNFTTALTAHPITSDTLSEYHGPVAVAQLPASHDAPTDQTEYLAWFAGLSQARQDALIEESNQRSEADMLVALEESPEPVAAAIPPRGMTAEQLLLGGADPLHVFVAHVLASLEESPEPVAAAIPPRGMTAEQLVEVTDIVKSIMANAHNIPQDQFPGHIALTLSRAGYHK